MKIILGVLVGLLALPAFSADPGNQWPSLPAVPPQPKDNPTTPAKVELGKMLYFDPRFSETGTVSCFSCHNVMEGGDDHRPTSIGVHGQKGGRNAPTVWNAAFLSSQFWDGRAGSLEDQAKGPVTNPVEMGMKDLQSAMDRIRRIPGYQQSFEAAFGTGDVMTIGNAAKAIASYERTLITPGSAYDRFVSGERTAMTQQQISGMQRFQDLGCAACHQGPAFAGPMGLPANTPFLMKFPVFPASPYVATYDLAKDQGRFESTGKESDRHLWRVPTLRNLVYTAPYMHNGAVKTLPEAVRVMGSTQLNRTLSDQEVGEIVAFLESLTGPFPAQTMPKLPPTPGDLLQ